MPGDQRDMRLENARHYSTRNTELVCSIEENGQGRRTAQVNQLWSNSFKLSMMPRSSYTLVSNCACPVRLPRDGKSEEVWNVAKTSSKCRTWYDHLCRLVRCFQIVVVVLQEEST